jgi:hypothetical protein
VRKLVVTQNITVDGSIEMLGTGSILKDKVIRLTWRRSCDDRTAVRMHS